jgi:hypothetical protein
LVVLEWRIKKLKFKNINSFYQVFLQISERYLWGREKRKKSLNSGTHVHTCHRLVEKLTRCVFHNNNASRISNSKQGHPDMKKDHNSCPHYLASSQNNAATRCNNMICVKSGTQFYQPLFTKACL